MFALKYSFITEFTLSHNRQSVCFLLFTQNVFFLLRETETIAIIWGKSMILFLSLASGIITCDNHNLRLFSKVTETIQKSFIYSIGRPIDLSDVLYARYWSRRVSPTENSAQRVLGANEHTTLPSVSLSKACTSLILNTGLVQIFTFPCILGACHPPRSDYSL